MEWERPGRAKLLDSSKEIYSVEKGNYYPHYFSFFRHVLSGATDAEGNVTLFKRFLFDGKPFDRRAVVGVQEDLSCKPVRAG